MPKFYAGGADKVTRGFFLIMEDLSEHYTMVWTLEPIWDLTLRLGSPKENIWLNLSKMQRSTSLRTYYLPIFGIVLPWFFRPTERKICSSATLNFF